jgi:hypothetical protein
MAGRMDVVEMEIMRTEYEEKEAYFFTTTTFCNSFRSLRNMQYLRKCGMCRNDRYTYAQYEASNYLIIYLSIALQSFVGPSLLLFF